MWFWERKEIYAGCSMKEFTQIWQALRDHGLDYDYRMGNQQRHSFDRSVAVGRWGYDSRFDTIYYIYVRKQDFDAAQNVLKNLK